MFPPKQSAYLDVYE